MLLENITNVARLYITTGLRRQFGKFIFLILDFVLIEGNVFLNDRLTAVIPKSILMSSLLTCLLISFQCSGINLYGVKCRNVRSW